MRGGAPGTAWAPRVHRAGTAPRAGRLARPGPFRRGPFRRGPFRRVAVLAALVVTAAAVLCSTSLLDDDTAQLVDDVGQLAGGVFATVCCGVTWRRAVRAGRPRHAWLWRLLLGLGTLGWTLGQAVWSWYQLVAQRALPSPSLADVGYFALPFFALPALLVVPPGPGRWAHTPDDPSPFPRSERHGRLLLGLDALVIVGSLLLLTWSTSLGAVVHAGAPTAGAFLIAVGYPVTDVALVVIVLLIAVLRRPARPQCLVLLGAGLVALSVSDSFFLYVVSTGAEDMPPVYDIGFLAGPFLIGLAALAPEPAARRHGPADLGRAVTWYTLLPYVPLSLIGLLVVGQEFAGVEVGAVETSGLMVLVAVVVTRQLLTLLENLELLRRVRDGQERLHHQAYHDWLTGLPNRALFRDRLEQAVERHRSAGVRLAVLFCDLDDFKGVNDSFGHPAGDHLLQVTGERLHRGLGPGDTVARLGGDEFAVILDDHPAPVDAARELLAAVSQPVALAGRPHLPQASAGLVVVEDGEPSLTSSVLLHRADAAMYAAKRDGKGKLVEYRPDLDPDARGTDFAAGVVAALTRTLAAHGLPPDPVDRASPADLPDAAGLDLAYQPIVRLADGELVAVEALLRWQHPGSGAVPPDLIVHLAETADLLDQLEDLVLDLACRDIAAIRSDGGLQVAVHVNISASRVTQDSLVDRVRGALQRHGLPGQALVLEVTETGRITDLGIAATVLAGVRTLGVGLALDDFGAGNSNLDYLLRLPIDVLKLDRALIVDGQGTTRADAISAGAIQIAHGLDMPVIAEGIEEEAQAERLRTLGCEFGQGYLYARPLPVTDLGGAVTAR